AAGIRIDRRDLTHVVNHQIVLAAVALDGEPVAGLDPVEALPGGAGRTLLRVALEAVLPVATLREGGELVLAAPQEAARPVATLAGRALVLAVLLESGLARIRARDAGHQGVDVDERRAALGSALAAIEKVELEE